jgi:putative SOS response-associated peptidase YedK
MNFLKQAFVLALFLTILLQGTATDHGLSTNNCRVETVQTSPLYSSAFRNGHRCIILANGFYEWLRKGTHKQPYFMHLPQPQGVSSILIY